MAVVNSFLLRSKRGQDGTNGGNEWTDAFMDSTPVQLLVFLVAVLLVGLSIIIGRVPVVGDFAVQTLDSSVAAAQLALTDYALWVCQRINHDELQRVLVSVHSVVVAVLKLKRDQNRKQTLVFSPVN